MSKPSPTMRAVLRRMNTGWELGFYAGRVRDRVVIQCGGLGMGGVAKGVPLPTLDALVARALICQAAREIGDFATRYALTERGRALAAAKAGGGRA